MVHYPLYTHNLSLVGVCVKRIGKEHSMDPKYNEEIKDRYRKSAEYKKAVIELLIAHSK